MIFAIFSLALLYRGRVLNLDVLDESLHYEIPYVDAIEDRYSSSSAYRMTRPFEQRSKLTALPGPGQFIFGWRLL